MALAEKVIEVEIFQFQETELLSKTAPEGSQRFKIEASSAYCLKLQH
jgi:hypothetical protein